MAEKRVEKDARTKVEQRHLETGVELTAEQVDKIEKKNDTQNLQDEASYSARQRERILRHRASSL